MQEPGPAARSAPDSGFPLQTALPVVIFVVVNRLAGLRWAVVAATVWSLKVIVDRRRKGLPLGRFMPIVTAAVLARGAIGAVTGDESLYFGLGIATKYAVAAALAVSVIAGRPLAALAARTLIPLPQGIDLDSNFRSAMCWVTAIGAIYYTLSASFDVWLFQRSSVEGFVVLRFLANWPMSLLAIGIALAIARTKLRRVEGLEPLSELLERRMEATIKDGKS